jgi:hypothetical protein
MKNVIDSQNSLITASQKRESETKASLHQMYRAISQYAVAWEKGPGQVVDMSYPLYRAEDLIGMGSPVIVDRIGKAFSVISAALGQTSDEIAQIYKEMDMNIAASLEDFRTIEANERRNVQGAPLLGTSQAAAPTKRPETPEVQLADRSRADSAVATPEADAKPATNDKKQTNKPNGSGQKKASSRPIGAVMDALAGSTSSKK